MPQAEKTRPDIQNYGCNGNLLCDHDSIIIIIIIIITVRKLNSLKHLVRTTEAKSHN